MLRVLKYLLGILVVAVIAVLGYAMMQPDDFRVERTTTIAAPPEKIIAIVSDFRRSGEWSPWEKLDPAMKRTHSGAPTGVGAIYEWDGNDDIGAGRQEILSVEPGLVHMKLDFIRPFEASNFADFQLEPDGAGTKVTWSIHGPNPLVSKVMNIFMNFDAMIGKDFDNGLAALKALAEKP